MKINVIILFLFFPLILNGQIRIDFKIENYSDIEIDSFKVGVNTSSLNSKFKYEESNFLRDTGTIIIPKNKFVFCTITYYREDLEFSTDIFPTFMFENRLSYKEVIIPAYKLSVETSDFWNNKYYFNNVLCNGHIVDYYKNGNKRLEGRFKNGDAIKLIQYNKDGKVSKVEKYNKKGHIKRSKKKHNKK